MKKLVLRYLLLHLRMTLLQQLDAVLTLRECRRGAALISKQHLLIS
jgi:hypothetical protein